MQIATIALHIAWQDIDTNLARISQFVAQAKADGCDTVVLPEVCTSGFLADPGLIEPPQGKSYQTMQRLAHSHHINIVAGLSEKMADTKAKNIAVAFNKQGDEVAHFSKLHPFRYANEQETFQAGDAPCVFSLDGVHCAVFICYDLRFPEVFRQVARQVEVIFVIANWPDTRAKHWQALLTARAIENQCYIVGVNRIGSDGAHLHYNGDCMVINPLGKALLHTDANTEYAHTHIAPDEVARIRAKYPFLEDMRFC